MNARVARLRVDVPLAIHLSSVGPPLRAGAYEVIGVRAGDVVFASVPTTADGAERTWFLSAQRSNGGVMISFQERVMALAATRTMREAINLASIEDAVGAQAYAGGAVVGPPAVVGPLAIGSRVTIASPAVQSPAQIGQTFTVASIAGSGDDAMASLKDAGGVMHKWFRVTDLRPATRPAVPPTTSPSHLSLSARPGETFDELAWRYASEHKLSLADAIHHVALARPDLAASR